MTDKYAVIGNPIAHSKSPQIHQLFAQQTGQDISYESIEASLDGFAATIERLRNQGYKGCNVTVPFKFQALQLATKPSERAQQAQAANTLHFNVGQIIADNSDGAGLIRDIEHNFGIALHDKRVLLVGAGGAASGVAAPLLHSGAVLTIVNRTASKAMELSRLLANPAIRTCSFDEIHSQQFDIIINATSSALQNEKPALSPGIFAHSTLAYEMMYGRETPFMKFAREHGAAIVTDGLGMLVEQAAESFYIWRKVRPETAPVIAALRQF